MALKEPEESKEYHKPVIDIANNSMMKGEVREGKQLIAWDSIQDCNTERCPIGKTCLYARISKEKCALQVGYLQNLTDTIFSTYRYLDETSMFKIGMHLIPLYSQLCRQKIVEKSVGRLAYEDEKGRTHIHPIYKEIRETMKVITILWREMGFPVAMNPDVPTGKAGFGDASHYETISREADNKRNIVR